MYDRLNAAGRPDARGLSLVAVGECELGVWIASGLAWSMPEHLERYDCVSCRVLYLVCMY